MVEQKEKKDMGAGDGSAKRRVAHRSQKPEAAEPEAAEQVKDGVVQVMSAAQRAAERARKREQAQRMAIERAAERAERHQASGKESQGGVK